MSTKQTGIEIQSVPALVVDRLCATLIEILDGSNDQATKIAACGVVETMASRLMPSGINVSNNQVRFEGGKTDVRQWQEDDLRLPPGSPGNG